MRRKISVFIKVIAVLLITFTFKVNANLLSNKIENTSINYTVDLTTMALRITEFENSRLFNPIDSYTGELTGYVYNCPLCNGTLACMRSLDLSKGLTTYKDNEYGEINIVASSLNLSCGTIVRFKSDKISERDTLAIVLDRGVIGNDLDLLVKTEDYARSVVGRSVINYEILRKGFSNEA